MKENKKDTEFNAISLFMKELLSEPPKLTDKDIGLFLRYNPFLEHLTEEEWKDLLS